MLHAPILTLAGPTAAGKTALSIELAQYLGAEIISVDSRQVYRRLDIGTAKPSLAERAGIPHHFIDELDLGQAFSAGHFAQAASQRIADILSRGRVPLVVGGSTLYLQALQQGLADIPAVDPQWREQLMARLNQEGAHALYEELKRIDPRAAATMDQTKTQRLIRALEVFYGTGMPLSRYHERQQAPRYTFKTFVVTWDRAVLYDRINRRVDQMLSDGLLQEVRSLLDSGMDPDANPLRTIGYQEVLAYFRGASDEATMVALIKRNTRRYAKRQLTWLRRFPAFVWGRPKTILQALRTEAT